MQEMPLGAFFEEQHTFAMKMNSLCLSDSELGLLNAIMIMNPSKSWTSSIAVFPLVPYFQKVCHNVPHFLSCPINPILSVAASYPYFTVTSICVARCKIWMRLVLAV